MEKNDSLSKIYDLRSRLGMIILLDQRISSKKQKVEKAIQEKEQQINDYADKVGQEAQNYESSWRRFYYGQEAEEKKAVRDKLLHVFLQEEQEEKKAWRKSLTKKIIAAVLLTLILAALFFIFFAAFIISVQETRLYDRLDELFNEAGLTIIMVMTIVVFVQIVVSVIMRLNFKYTPKARDKFEQNYKNEEKIIESKYYEKRVKITKSDEYQKLAKEARAKKEQYGVTVNRQQKALLAELKEMVLTKRSICNQTHKQYDDFINPVDWQHLDLLIYLFETGRATNVKEALKEVDTRLRHDQLLNTIDKVGNQIQEAIRQSLNKLERSINNRLTSIEHRVNIIGQTVDQRLDLMESQMAVMHRERIDAIEGLKFTMTANSMALSKQANEAYRSIDQELRYIALNTR